MISYQLPGQHAGRLLRFATYELLALNARVEMAQTCNWPGAGLRSWSSAASRAVPAARAAASACLTRAAAVFLAGLGTMRSGSSGAAA